MTSPKQLGPQLDLQESLALVQPGGQLSKFLSHFEPRLAQQKMMADIITAYNQRHIALIEAGTGTGKSVAYLIPAILWALKNKEKTVISTNTIALQEQLLNKDIPLLSKALQVDFKAVLVKGMNNYICKRKLEEALGELPLYTPEEGNEIKRIDACQGQTLEGSRSELPFVPSGNAWEKVGAESDTCNKVECPFFQECYFFKARRKANDAQILITNHHLLFADLALRSDKDNSQDTAILPAYDRIILDEAHHIEEVATEHFAEKISQIGFFRNLARIAGEKRGKLSQLKVKFEQIFSKQTSTEIATIQQKLILEIPGLKHDLQIVANELFQTCADFAEQLNSEITKDEEIDDIKLRLRPNYFEYAFWQKEVIPKSLRLVESIKNFVVAIESLEKELGRLPHEKFQEQTKSLRHDILALASRFSNFNELIQKFIQSKFESKVRWIERLMMRQAANVHLIEADLDLAPRLAQCLFSKFSTIVLCSATLTTNKNFNFIRSQLGLHAHLLADKKVAESIYESPFDYAKQALFITPQGLPSPSHPDFLKQAADCIWQALEASKGNAFVLFTSYSMLRSCYQLLFQPMSQKKMSPLKQGDDNRQSLLMRFKSTEGSVLFGTDSFWEGVDVVGDALRCVILVKLPFKVPSEPIIEARNELIAARGGDPFLEYTLPNAIVKFKQGFGRLIRNKQDRGCVVCLDPRLLTKGYGKLFINSLPSCQQSFAKPPFISEVMKDFYWTKKRHGEQ